LGRRDIGWEGNISAGTWTFLAYTTIRDADTTVYKEAAVANTETLLAPLAIWAVDNTGARCPSVSPLRTTLMAPRQRDSVAASPSARSRFMTALDAATIESHFSRDAIIFGILDEDNDGMPTSYERQYPFLNPKDASTQRRTRTVTG